MQFSKRVSELARTHAVDPKDVLFAMLATAGASTAEAFAVIYRPTVSTSAALTTRAANYVGQRPGLKRLIKFLDAERVAPADGQTKPEKATKGKGKAKKAEDAPELDYTDKDAVLQELARIAGRCEKESDRLAAIREIISAQRMKQEAKIEEEKRVQFYIPLSYERAEELTNYLARYFSEKAESQPEKPTGEGAKDKPATIVTTPPR